MSNRIESRLGAMAGIWDRGVTYTISMVSLLRLVFSVFVLFLALSFFGVSIQAVVNSPAGQANLAYLSNLLSQAWQYFANVLFDVCKMLPIFCAKF